MIPSSSSTRFADKSNCFEKSQSTLLYFASIQMAIQQDEETELYMIYFMACPRADVCSFCSYTPVLCLRCPLLTSSANCLISLARSDLFRKLLFIMEDYIIALYSLLHYITPFWNKMQPATQQNFDSKKILPYIQKLQADLDSIRMFNKQLQKHEKSSNEAIIRISEEKNEILSLIKNAELKKSFESLNYLSLEKESTDKTLKLIGEIIYKLIEQHKKTLTDMRSRINEMEKKKKRKNLENSEIKALKEDLIKMNLQIKKSIAEIVSRQSQWYIKENCSLLEFLTKLMKSNHPAQELNKKQQKKK